MTEDEAKKKWCPFSRIGASGGNGNNRWIESAGEDATTAANYKPVLCIASACMAWRWTDAGRQPVAGYQDASGASHATQWADSAAPPIDGFCGLAGTPQ